MSDTPKENLITWCRNKDLTKSYRNMIMSEPIDRDNVGRSVTDILAEDVDNSDEIVKKIEKKFKEEYENIRKKNMMPSKLLKHDIVALGDIKRATSKRKRAFDNTSIDLIKNFKKNFGNEPQEIRHSKIIEETTKVTSTPKNSSVLTTPLNTFQQINMRQDKSITRISNPRSCSSIASKAAMVGSGDSFLRRQKSLVDDETENFSPFAPIDINKNYVHQGSPNFSPTRSVASKNNSCYDVEDKALDKSFDGSYPDYYYKNGENPENDHGCITHYEPYTERIAQCPEFINQTHPQMFQRSQSPDFLWEVQYKTVTISTQRKFF